MAPAHGPDSWEAAALRRVMGVREALVSEMERLPSIPLPAMAALRGYLPCPRHRIGQVPGRLGARTVAARLKPVRDRAGELAGGSCGRTRALPSLPGPPKEAARP